MIIKKFIGKNEEEAVKNAKAELGAATVIMNVRTIKRRGLAKLFRKPQTEVTAAVEEEKDTVVSQTKPIPRPLQSKQYKDVITDEETDTTKTGSDNTSEPSAKTGENETAIEQKLESIHTLIEQQLKSSKEQIPEESEEDNTDAHKGKGADDVRFMKLIYNTLIENEVDERYANDLIDEITRINKPGQSIDSMLSNIYQKLILKFGQPKEIEPATQGAKIVFFIGPTGVGKTTTIAKIASRLCVNDKKKVALITTDTYRIKAAEQLRTYADILEIPFRIVYTGEDLTKSLNEFGNMDYILVDTAGHSPHNEAQCEAMKAFLNDASKIGEVESYLVLSTTTKYRDLATIADIYKGMADYRLIFTKLDETDTYGNILNIKIRTGADISYVTDGQDVPDDMEIFNPQVIVKSLLGGKMENGEI